MRAEIVTTDYCSEFCCYDLKLFFKMRAKEIPLSLPLKMQLIEHFQYVLSSPQHEIYTKGQIEIYEPPTWHDCPHLNRLKILYIRLIRKLMGIALCFSLQFPLSARGTGDSKGGLIVTMFCT